ncbi:hypothetical protein [Emticicia sp. 21SJ11W-3]|uniref:hypothetical protein n=1 Tax=Emticicia sp. 21SJ11W-3 TaxID=2916755 RepID=UPI0020A20678|nr:hypothetical protein [Emticicia sp. 21SJ11W-3]UTA66594.1 hypothetical protein MB380_13390 [Emticicia sp. 21SJ11W-3]
MHRLYIETTNPSGKKKTNEYRFFEHLLNILGKQADIVGIHGKTRLAEFENSFIDTKKRGFKNLIIIDADGNHNTPGWSFQRECSKIQNTLDTFCVGCEFFLEFDTILG